MTGDRPPPDDATPLPSPWEQEPVGERAPHDRAAAKERDGARPKKDAGTRREAARGGAETRLGGVRSDTFRGMRLADMTTPRRHEGRLWLRLGIAFAVTLLATTAALVYPWVERRSAWFSVEWRYPWVLAFLALVPAVLWFGTFGHDRRRPRMRIGSVVPLAAGPRGLRTHLRDVPGITRGVAVALGVVALARPINILSDQSSEEQGIDIMLVMDLSGSMRAVLDADPKDLPNTDELPRGTRITRLDAAKIVVQDFITRRNTDRMGAIVFGKSAYVLSPPTLDYQLLGALVSKLSLDVIDGSATAIGDALGAAVARMRRSEALSKVVILLTDGDSNAGLVSPEFAIEAAVEKGCKVYTVQIGNGDEVEVQDSVDVFGQPHYVRTRFPVNPELLNRIAQQTGGQYFVATDAKSLSQSFHTVLDQLEKTRFEAQIASHEDLFPFLLIPAAALIALEALLGAWLLRRFP